jgi:UDP-glucuronate decarboxylase
VVSNFVNAALKGEDLLIYGNGQQSRSLQYIHDLVDGLILLMESDTPVTKESPINLGTTVEKSISEWAQIVIDVVDQVLEETGADKDRKRSVIKFVDALPDDPPKRRADITKAQRELGWRPRFSIEDGIRETTKFFLGTA